MLEPLGPLPEVVYWRRRGVALGVLVVLLLGLWGVSAALTPGDDSPTKGTLGAPASTTSASPSSTPPSSAPPSSTPPSSTPPSRTPPPGTTALSSSVVPTPAPIGPCSDQAIGLTARPSAAEYGRGQPYEFRMVVANVGALPCHRDLDAALQEVMVVAADGVRLWSSNDCNPGGVPAVRTLAPGEQLVFSVVWAGRTSQPGCPAQREAVPAGAYQLVVKLGSLASQPAPFRLLG